MVNSIQIQTNNEAKAYITSHVSRETMARLEIYVENLIKWNKTINLIAKNTEDSIWQRHILDSLQLKNYSQNFQNWLDIGSGGGLPALVLAAIYPQTHFILVESDQRKSAFLRSTAQKMQVNLTVLNDRIENLNHFSVDVISARACAALTQLLEWSYPFFNNTTILLLPKGKNWNDELTEAKKNWHITAEIHQSMTDSQAKILEITNVRKK